MSFAKAPQTDIGRLQLLKELAQEAAEFFEDALATISKSEGQPDTKDRVRVSLMTRFGIARVVEAHELERELAPFSRPEWNDLYQMAELGQRLGAVAQALQAAMYDHPDFGVPDLMTITEPDPRFLRVGIAHRRPPFGTPIPQQP